MVEVSGSRARLAAAIIVEKQEGMSRLAEEQLEMKVFREMKRVYLTQLRGQLGGVPDRLAAAEHKGS